MTAAERVLDLRQLRRQVPGRRASIWLGMALFVLIEATVIASLLTSYWYFRVMARAGWPPPGVEPPELFRPALSLALLVSTLVPVRRARRAQEAGRRRDFVLSLGAACGLLGVYLGWALFDLLELPYQGSEHVYGSLMWTVSGYQLLHGIALLLLALGILILGTRSRADQVPGEPALPREAALAVLALYWTFVVVASVPTYFTLYLAPYAS